MKLTGPRKLFHHPEVLARQRVPVSVQLSLTGRCNLACSYCVSRPAREETHDMPLSEVLELLNQLWVMGTRTLELTGGGEPTLHIDFETLLATMLQRGFAVGLVTNGTLLGDVPPELLASLDWIRISITRAHVGRKRGDLDPRIVDNLARCYRTNKGLSFVMTGDSREDAKYLPVIKSWARGHMRYIRLCKDVRMGPHAEPFEGDVVELTTRISKEVRPGMEVVNDCHRSYRVPKRCLIGYYKPAISHTGQVYRCCTEFNGGAQAQCHWRELEGTWTVIGLIEHTTPCTTCIYGDTNDVLALLQQPLPTNPNFL